jgi:hypothetical protein
MAGIAVGKVFQGGCWRLTPFVSSAVQTDKVFGAYLFSLFLARRFDWSIVYFLV